jgi:hypothetical protein
MEMPRRFVAARQAELDARRTGGESPVRQKPYQSHDMRAFVASLQDARR